MTTNYHTAITTGAAANAATFNSPMGELDAALTNIASFTRQSVTGAKTIANGDDEGFLVTNGTFTITLPDSLNDGVKLLVFNKGTGTITFSASGTATLVAASSTIAGQGAACSLYYNATDDEWYKL